MTATTRYDRVDTDDVRALPVPAWLAAHSEPNIEAIVAMLGPERQQLPPLPG